MAACHAHTSGRDVLKRATECMICVMLYRKLEGSASHCHFVEVGKDGEDGWRVRGFEDSGQGLALG